MNVRDSSDVFTIFWIRHHPLYVMKPQALWSHYRLHPLRSRWVSRCSTAKRNLALCLPVPGLCPCPTCKALSLIWILTLYFFTLSWTCLLVRGWIIILLKISNSRLQQHATLNWLWRKVTTTWSWLFLIDLLPYNRILLMRKLYRSVSDILLQGNKWIIHVLLRQQLEEVLHCLQSVFCIH
jgi:hypothetical protein